MRRWIFFGAVLFLPVSFAYAQSSSPLCSVSSDVRGGVYTAPVAGALTIEEADTPGQQYSRSGTANKKPFIAIVMHYTESGTCDTNALVRSTKAPNPRCGGSPCGYHFLVGPDGRVVNVASLEKRTNHVKDQTGSGVNNTNSIGVSLVCGERGETQLAQQSAQRLVRMLQQKYNIPNSRIYAHPEIQPDKGKNEARQITALLRGGSGPGGPVAFSLPSGEVIWCKSEALSQQPDTFATAIQRAGTQLLRGDPRSALQTIQQQLATPAITEIASPDSPRIPSGFSQGTNGTLVWSSQALPAVGTTTQNNSIKNVSDAPFDFTKEPGAQLDAYSQEQNTPPIDTEGFRFINGEYIESKEEKSGDVSDTQSIGTVLACPSRYVLEEKLQALNAQRNLLGAYSSWLGRVVGFLENSDAQRVRLDTAITETQTMLEQCDSFFLAPTQSTL